MRQDGRMQHSERPGPTDGGPRRGWVAPRFLYPVLSLAEWIDRRARRIRPIRPGGLLGVERHHYRGEPLELADGTIVHQGDRADIIHFDNARLRDLADPALQVRAMAEARLDFRALAGQLRTRSADERPVAFRGTTILAPYARRFGFEIHERRPTPWHRLEDWYLRTILVRWAPTGRERLRSGHSDLTVGEGWLSLSVLERRYGPDADGSRDRRSPGGQ
jgi:hypothetical protein